MNTKAKTRRRGLVMTGGGAKGIYEAGVIHAFHLLGMEFDVIAGSSIGAFNSVFFAEYLLRKKGLSPEILEDPIEIIKKMDPMVRAYHHAWLQLPEKKIIDDSETGPIGQLKNTLQKIRITLSVLVRVLWWWTDPDKKALPPPVTWASFSKVGKSMFDLVGEEGKLFQIVKNREAGIINQITRTTLRKFGMEKSIIPPKDDDKLTSIFTKAVEPLQHSQLQDNKLAPLSKPVEKVPLVEPGRTLRDFEKAGIDVRLTRANYRTGRLEISAYVTTEDFVRYLKKNAFRVERSNPQEIPLISFRLMLPGNPDAAKAALASGRFPGVLAPLEVEKIYPDADPDNLILHGILNNWLDDQVVEDGLNKAYFEQYPDTHDQEIWRKAYQRWRGLKKLEEIFPKRGDAYVDGGSIDNTPSNTVIDATREWIDKTGKSKMDVELDSFIIFLEPKPVINPDNIDDPAIHQVIARTLKIQEVAKQTTDAVVVETINKFGKKAEALGRTLSVIVQSYQDQLSKMPQAEKDAILSDLYKSVQEAKLRGYLRETPDGLVERIGDWADGILDKSLPLQVNEVVIYPDKMPMGTLQFTERLGYRHNNAVEMLTTGCSHTLWTIWSSLGSRSKSKLDAKDQVYLQLAQTWTGLKDYPEKYEEVERLRKTWKCKRTACVFYDGHCQRGEGKD